MAGTGARSLEHMASASRFAPTPITLHRSFSPPAPTKPYLFFPPRSGHSSARLPLRSADLRGRHRLSGGEGLPEGPPDGEGPSFDRAVELFNGGDYHQCHDFLEELWNGAEEPIRTLLHGILQCAVGFHHLFNQNHRGAMMELGEGLCKLRKMDFDGGPFLEFEQEVSAALEFLYQTQKELAACTDDLCLAMDGSERSYQLLGSFAAGQHLYSLDVDPDGIAYITFSLVQNHGSDRSLRVKVPTLHAAEEHLKACEYKC
ncbi:uncharacterized protein LOC103709117 [Phoenix dactylifera]|uniref:Uncharacterized protein LOC103709117 n=1 Tax=Phoenix dactylifera TaxID=42345 RepID=A0A8B7C636_PHODC|nr:uncharacterized protein LOC103709117 [Phoenix dactylifera]